MARYKPDGSLDPGFGSGGVVTRPNGAAELVLRPDGKILLGGNGLVRLRADGSPDPTFGSNGLASSPIGIAALALQPDGRILAAGTGLLPNYSTDIELARFEPDGSLDPTFGTGGVVTTQISIGATASALVLLPGGRMVVGESVTDLDKNGWQSFVLVRYQANGALDATEAVGRELHQRHLRGARTP